MGLSPSPSRDSTRCDATAHIPCGVLNRVRFALVDEARLADIFRTRPVCNHSHVVHFLAADPTVLARADPVFEELLNRADLNISDGAPIVWALRLMGHDARRITAFDGVHLCCAAGIDERLRHYFFGSERHVLEALRSQLEQLHPGIAICGVESPPFRPLTDAEYDAAAAAVRAADCDVLWIGLGSPKQNYVAEEFRKREAAPMIVTVGAAFDFVGGTKRRAPGFLQRVGLEWLFRLLQEPRRLWRRYLIGNARFIAGASADVTAALVARRRKSRGSLPSPGG